jgi:hypothetical protein
MTERERPDFGSLLAPYAPEIRELALAIRERVRPEVPEALEIVYDAYNAVAIGYTFTGRTSDHFCHIAVYPKHVNVGFPKGTGLADPEGRLRGTGKWCRHIRLQSAPGAESEYLLALVQEAADRAPRPEAALAAGGESELRAVYPRRRRPGDAEE